MLFRLGSGLQFCVPLSIRPYRTCVVPFFPTIVTPIVLSRCLSRFGVDLGVGVPRISSMRLLRIRRCLVPVAKEMPCMGGGSPCFQDLMSRRWSHAASLCQTLPVVSSQDLASDSRVISALDVRRHSCMALVRLFFMIWQATSSVCIHLSTWAWSVWAMTASVVVYLIPPISFGEVHG
jgi:hypothetical protein